MARFDVHRNRGQNRDAIYRRRVVVPLVRTSHVDRISHPRFNPSFVIENIPVVLHPLEMVSVPKDRLGKRVDSLTKESDRIVDALDELMTRAHDR